MPVFWLEPTDKITPMIHLCVRKQKKGHSFLAEIVSPAFNAMKKKIKRIRSHLNVAEFASSWGTRLLAGFIHAKEASRACVHIAHERKYSKNKMPFF